MCRWSRLLKLEREMKNSRLVAMERGKIRMQMHNEGNLQMQILSRRTNLNDSSTVDDKFEEASAAIQNIKIYLYRDRFPQIPSKIFLKIQGDSFAFS